MLHIDQSLIGRQYITVHPTPVYTIRGINSKPDGFIVVLGEFKPSYSQDGTTEFSTHRVELVKLLPEQK